MSIETPFVESKPTDRAALSQPLYGASFGQAVSRFFTKYADFSGRASRSEFWWWMLASVLVSIVGSVIASFGVSGATLTADGQVVFGAAYWIGYGLIALWGLATLVPALALYWRRLHDTNKSGGFFFLGLIPFVGSIILLVLVLLPSDPAGARFDR